MDDSKQWTPFAWPEFLEWFTTKAPSYQRPLTKLSRWKMSVQLKLTFLHNRAITSGDIILARPFLSPDTAGVLLIILHSTELLELFASFLFALGLTADGAKRRWSMDMTSSSVRKDQVQSLDSNGIVSGQMATKPKLEPIVSCQRSIFKLLAIIGLKRNNLFSSCIHVNINDRCGGCTCRPERKSKCLTTRRTHRYSCICM